MSLRLLSLVFSLSLGACMVTKPNQNINPENTDAYANLSIDKAKLEYANVFIKPDNIWYMKLIQSNSRNTVIINASNPGISFGGGGINGAIQSYFAFLTPTASDWGQLYNQDGSLHVGGQPVADGAFVYTKHVSPIEFNYQFHAVGPMKSSYAKDFPQARQKIMSLVYDMLILAEKENIDNFVLPAISTAIFAGGDDEFKKQMYEGMVDGIFKFIQEKGSSTKPSKIILNSWAQSDNPALSRLKSKTK